VSKFGGTSLADATQFRKVREIVAADPQRRFIVPSAPGKRHRDDQKITDLLYLCHASATQHVAFEQTLSLISDRFEQIVRDLGLTVELPLDEIRDQIQSLGDSGDPRGGDYAASRGEYLNGLVMAAWLNLPFVDAAQIIRFDKSGRLDRDRTRRLIAETLPPLGGAVVPGFYGSDADGRIVTFTRGGSDVTGALVAQGVAAAMYENWTDVSGMLMADPRIVDNPCRIDTLTYRELRELSYMGAGVLHEEAIFPVRSAGIPVNIRNTNAPEDIGTTIVPDNFADLTQNTGSITGIAGRKDFTVFAVEKALMNSEVGFGRRLLSVFENHGVSYEHTPSGIDTMSVVVADAMVEGKVEDLLSDIRAECKPDQLEASANMALIATVGRGMAHTPGMAARLFTALADAGVNVRMIDQGSSELNIIVGVETGDFEPAVRAIYRGFAGEG